jgi:hypothetical protein
MKRIKNFLKSLVSILIVFLGSYFVSFYLTNEISFTSVFVGFIGLLIIQPAITKWNEMLFGEKTDEKNIL